MSVFDPDNGTLRFWKVFRDAHKYEPMDVATLSFCKAHMGDKMLYEPAEISFAAMLNGLKVEWSG